MFEVQVLENDVIGTYKSIGRFYTVEEAQALYYETRKNVPLTPARLVHELVLSRN
jgi:hypothetical protein